MKKHESRHETAGEGLHGEDQSLQDLFRHADARVKPSAEHEQQIRDKLHSHWRHKVRSRRRRGTVAAFGLAASLVLAVVVVQQAVNRSPQAPEAVGAIVKRTGSVTLEPVNRASAAPGSHEPGTLFSGYQVSTGEGALLAVNWLGGESVRLGENARVRLLSATNIELLAGSIYIDTAPPGSDSNDGNLVVSTFAGDIRHIGTQYLAAVNGGGIQVSVREGKVAVMGSGGESFAAAGQQVNLSLDGASRIQPVNTWGALWAWTEIAAPSLELDGRTIMEFLEHVARESGHQLAFSDAAAEDMARTATLTGSIDLPPMKALEVVLQTTDLVATADEGSILVRFR